MGKYLVRVEAMDGDEKLDMEYTDGIECDGFVIVADQGDHTTLAIHKMSIDAISIAISNNDDLMAAGILAKAKREIVDIEKRGIKNNLLDILGKLSDG